MVGLRQTPAQARSLVPDASHEPGGFLDGFKLGLGYVHYNPGNNEDAPGPMFGLDSHDTLFLKIRYDFLLL